METEAKSPPSSQNIDRNIKEASQASVVISPELPTFQDWATSHFSTEERQPSEGTKNAQTSYNSLEDPVKLSDAPLWLLTSAISTSEPPPLSTTISTPITAAPPPRSQTIETHQIPSLRQVTVPYLVSFRMSPSMVILPSLPSVKERKTENNKPIGLPIAENLKETRSSSTNGLATFWSQPNASSTTTTPSPLIPYGTRTKLPIITTTTTTAKIIEATTTTTDKPKTTTTKAVHPVRPSSAAPVDLGPLLTQVVLDQIAAVSSELDEIPIEKSFNDTDINTLNNGIEFAEKRSSSDLVESKIVNNKQKISAVKPEEWLNQRTHPTDSFVKPFVPSQLLSVGSVKINLAPTDFQPSFGPTASNQPPAVHQFKPINNHFQQQTNNFHPTAQYNSEAPRPVAYKPEPDWLNFQSERPSFNHFQNVWQPHNQIQSQQSVQNFVVDSTQKTVSSSQPKRPQINQIPPVPQKPQPATLPTYREVVKPVKYETAAQYSYDDPELYKYQILTPPKPITYQQQVKDFQELQKSRSIPPVETQKKPISAPQTESPQKKPVVLVYGPWSAGTVQPPPSNQAYQVVFTIGPNYGVQLDRVSSIPGEKQPQPNKVTQTVAQQPPRYNFWESTDNLNTKKSFDKLNTKITPPAVAASTVHRPLFTRPPPPPPRSKFIPSPSIPANHLQLSKPHHHAVNNLSNDWRREAKSGWNENSIQMQKFTDHSAPFRPSFLLSMTKSALRR